MRKFSTRELALAGLVAAVYAVLSLAFQPISFGVYQVRIAEALTVIPFLTVAAIPGLFIGCLLANILGGMGWLDIVIGPLITLFAGILTYYAGRLKRHTLIGACAIAAIALMWIGAIYLLTSFEFTSKSIGGVILSFAGLLPVVFASIGKQKVNPLIKEHFWTIVIVMLILILVSILLLRSTDDLFFLVCGSLLLIAAVLSAITLTWILIKGHNQGILLAPFPPVILNAFGVSAYLAGIIGVDYWFCVQMIGIGQLIACYVLGLPILIILKRRKIFG